MLVLSRRAEQSLTVKIPPCEHERELKLSVLEIRHGLTVQLGFDAPKEIAIIRDDAIKISPNPRCPDCGRSLILCRCGGGECNAERKMVVANTE